MIDDEKTFVERGYKSTDLSIHSGKEVYAVCDGCGKGRWLRFQCYRNLCVTCAAKKGRKYNYDHLKNVVRNIDEEKTFDEKGYYSTELSAKSRKKVYAICTECGEGRWVELGSYRDLCHVCASKKRRKYAYEDIDRSSMNIDEEITFEESGYRSSDLSAGSSKKVYAICTECGEGRWISFSLYRNVCFKCIHKTDKHRKTLRDNHTDISGEDNPNWQGGISFGEYCPKFNEPFKEGIRNKFDRKCFICDKTEQDNGRKLCVHHVNYDKDCLCDGYKCMFVPLCMKCHAKTGHDRDLWERLITNVLWYECANDHVPNMRGNI
jgi:hypothetical protein